MEQADLDSRPRIELNSEEAIAWLRSVDGELYRTPTGNATNLGVWVAVVRTPAFEGSRAQLIIAVGDTALEAAEAAACQWRSAWDQVPQGH